MDRMVLGFLVGTWSSCHPVILSDLSRDVPVLDPGFWVVERGRSATGPATGSVRIATRRAGWRPFAEPSGSLPDEVDLAARIANDARAEPVPHRWWLSSGRGRKPTA